MYDTSAKMRGGKTLGIVIKPIVYLWRWHSMGGDGKKICYGQNTAVDRGLRVGAGQKVLTWLWGQLLRSFVALSAYMETFT